MTTKKGYIVPIPKRNYMRLGKQIVWHYDLPDVKGFELIFYQYLLRNNCSEFRKVRNEYSRFDYILSSGTTDCVLEYKQRRNEIADFYNGFIEVQKFDNLRTLAELMDAPAFYVCDYVDAVLIWQLDFSKTYRADIIPAQASNGSSEKKMKKIYYLDYEDASIIIGKKTWHRASVNDLKEYLTRKRNER